MIWPLTDIRPWPQPGTLDVGQEHLHACGGTGEVEPGRPPQLLPIYNPEFMKIWSDMRGADLARFIALAKRGHPYENHMVIEDVPGKTPERLPPPCDINRRTTWSAAWSTPARCWIWA